MADNSPAKTDSADEEDKDSGASSSFTTKPGNSCTVNCDVDATSELEQLALNSSSTSSTEIASGLVGETTCNVGPGGSHLNSQDLNKSSGLLPAEVEMGCSHAKGCIVSGHDGSQPNIAQSTPLNKACSSQRAGNRQHMNGLVSVCAHTSGTVVAQGNALSVSQGIASGGGGGGGVIHVNGNGAVFHDLSACNNCDQATPNAGLSGQCHKGARPKKLKRRPCRDDRHSRTSLFDKAPLDSDDEDMNLLSNGTKTMPNVVGFSSSVEIRIRNQCNGDLPHHYRVPELPSHLSSSSQANRNDIQGAAAPPQLQRDEDMVDEGAVCDFDRNVLAGENLYCIEDTSVSSPSDGGGANMEPNFPNGQVSYSTDCSYQVRERQRQFSPNGLYSGSDSEEDAFVRVPMAGGGVQAGAHNVEDVEDNGDFIDTDLPARSGQLMSSSADSASLSSTNGDAADGGPLQPLPGFQGSIMANALLSSHGAEVGHMPVVQGNSNRPAAALPCSSRDGVAEGRLPSHSSRREQSSSSRQENDLSGGSDKELNRKHNSFPDLRLLSDSATFRTSYSSPSHEGGFDNFLLPRDLSSSDGVFWNSSESENEDEMSEGGGCPPPPSRELPTINNSSDIAGLVHEGAGVAEALVAHSEEHMGGEPQFGAGGGDLVCFYFDRACCMQENQWPTPPAAGCLPQHAHASQSASSRHCPADMPSEGEAGGACALPPPPVNNLSRLLPAATSSSLQLRGPGGESMANGLNDVASSNFINDESNRQQKVFDKFPMVEEGREGACGSSSGHHQGKCDDNNVLFLCPVAPAPGILMDRQGERDPGTLEPNVESCGTMAMAEYNYNNPHHWRANSESGVSEPVIFEDRTQGYRLYPSSDCSSITDNTLHHSLPLSKGSKDSKKKRIVCRPIENGMDSLPSVERMMIWSEYEAYLLQVKQIGMSACGQTAVLNLLKAFEIIVEKEEVCSTIQVSLRKEKASVAEYLASRAIAGTTAEELLSGVECLTKGEIRGRFFQMWPPRSVNLLSWLSQWMKRGAVPIATLNLQKGAKQQQIPDAWHHQMVYGVGPRGVYLTNPLELVSEDTMMGQLTSDSVLLVRRQDVVSRFQPTASLAPLLHHPDPRWCHMNVLGQVVNVLREHNMPSVPGYRAQVTSHVRIPAVYRAGITLYVRHNTAQWYALTNAPDLPLLSSSSSNSSFSHSCSSGGGSATATTTSTQ